MIQTPFFALLLVLIIYVACESQEPLAEAHLSEEVPLSASEEICLDNFPVCFAYETQAEWGSPKDEFREGENIIFSFEIRNLSDTDLTLKNENIFQGNPDFLHIKDESGETVVRLAEGFPFIYPTHFAIPNNASYKLRMSYEKVPGIQAHHLVSNGTDAEYQVSSPEGPLPELKAGNYHSTFTNDYIFRFANEDKEYTFSVPVSLQFSIQ